MTAADPERLMRLALQADLSASPNTYPMVFPLGDLNDGRATVDVGKHVDSA